MCVRSDACSKGSDEIGLVLSFFNFKLPFWGLGADMRIGGVEFLRSGEGLSPRGCPEFWFVTREVISESCWKGYYLEVPGVDGMLRVRRRCHGGWMLTNVPVYGDVVFLPEDGYRKDGSCDAGCGCRDGGDGRGRIYRRISDAGEDGILIADLWERYFLLTPDGRRRVSPPSP